MKYKCHVGHSYSERDLLFRLSEEMENLLWYVSRALEQRQSLFQTLMERYRRTGNHLMANDYQRRMEDLKTHIENLKNIIAANLDEPDDM